MASRLRLGMAPQDRLPVSCSCGVALAPDPHHFFSCKQKRSHLTQRHNLVLRCLAQLLSKAGGTVHIEPNWYEGVRPDAQVSFLLNSHMLDVSITHPSAPSIAANGALADLGAAKEVRRCSKIGPIVLETIGAFGSETSTF